MLLAKDVRDWVKEDSLERFVSDIIDLLDEEGRLELLTSTCHNG